MDEPEGVPPEQEPALIYGAVSSLARGDLVLHPRRERYLDVARSLYGDGFGMCSDLTGVDYLFHFDRQLPAGVLPERFEVAVNLLSTEDRKRIRLRVQVPESDPTVPSLFELYPGTEAMEREAYDMFGIVFDGHPDLSRILMPEDYEGFPQRRDFPVGGEPVLFTFNEHDEPRWYD